MKSRLVITPNRIYIFCVCYAVILRLLQGTYGAFNGTDVFNGFCSFSRYFLVVGLGIVFLLNGSFSIKKAAIAILVVISFIFSPAKTLIIGLMFTLSFPKRLNSTDVIRRVGYVVVFYLIIVILFSQIGLFVDLVNTRDGATRHSLGFVTPSGCSAVYTAAIFCITFANFDSLKYKHLAGILFGEILIYFVTGTRIGLVVMMFHAIICCVCISSNRHKQKLSKHINYCIIPSFIICSAASIWISVHFGRMETGRYSDPVYWALNNLFSGRIYYMSEYYDRYEIHLFGSETELVGTIHKQLTGAQWFGVDNSYIYILISFGIIGFAVICIIYFILSKYATKENNTALSVYLMAFAFFGLTEAVFTDLPYSLLFLIMGDCLSNQLYPLKRVKYENQYNLGKI